MPELHAVAGGRAGLGGRLRLGNPRPVVAMPGDTQFALVVLVLLELGALVWMRRVFKTAHGG